MDANTKRLALFSGIEVKQENGGKDEALVQLAIWLAAGSENLRRLSELGRQEVLPAEEDRPIVGWTVIGHDWHTYIAYRANRDGQDTFVSMLRDTRIIGQANQSRTERCRTMESCCHRYERYLWSF